MCFGSMHVIHNPMLAKISPIVNKFAYGLSLRLRQLQPPCSGGSVPEFATRLLRGLTEVWFVEISIFRKLDEDGVVALAHDLYQLLGGVALENIGRSDIWRRDENTGASAVYQITHGYHIADNGQGIAVIVTENWAETHADDKLIASAYTVKACDAVDLVVQYKNGQLTCRFSGDDQAEAECSNRIRLKL